MATLPDVILDGQSYINANTETGIVAGTPVVIQNKSSASIRIILSPAQPDSSSKNGWLLSPLKSIIVENESDPIWVKSDTDDFEARCSIQPYV